MSKEGFEPITELPEANSPVKEQVEQMAGHIRIKVPMPNAGLMRRKP